MIGEAKVTIVGFKFKKVGGTRTLKSVFIQDDKKGDCMEVSIKNEANIDKEKLANELLEYFRDEVVVFIDIQNDPDKSNSNYVDLRFVGIKK